MTIQPRKDMLVTVKIPTLKKKKKSSFQYFLWRALMV